MFKEMLQMLNNLQVVRNKLCQSVCIKYFHVGEDKLKKIKVGDNNCA